jgi:hypothetical protein
LPDDATVVEVGPGGQASGIDFALQPIRAVRVTGRVTSDAGSSAHAILRLLVPGEEDLGLGSEIASALVSSSGAFEFRGVPPGQYIIDAGESVAELVAAETPVAIGLSGQTAGPTTALPVPSAPEGTMLAVKRGDTINGMWAQQRVTVGTSDVNDIAIVLRGTTTVSGGVVWDGARGTAPAIRVEPASGSAHLAAPNPSRSATDRFEVRGLRPAEYFVRIASGAASVAVEGIAIGGVDYTHRPLDTSGGDVANVIVTLTSHTAAVAGAVRDATGHDVSSATVTLFPVDRSLWSRFGFDPPWMRAATVLNGSRYQLTSLAKGDYFIVASPVDSSRTWQNPEFLDEAARGALRISLDWGDTRQQDLVMMRRVNR